MRKVWNKVAGMARGAAEWVGGKAAAICGVVVGGVVAADVALTNTVMAAESVTIPAMPVDFADIGTKAAVVVGTVVAGTIGLVIVIKLIKMGIRFLGSFLAG